MNNPPKLLEFVLCPQCGLDLRYTKEEVLVCLPCRLCFPVEDGVPNLSLEASLSFSKSGEIIPRKTLAVFSIEAGEDAGVKFQLEPGTCKAIGRKLEDGAQTQIFNMDFNMTLDEQTKKLIKNYFVKTSKKKKTPVSEVKASATLDSDLGSFTRLPDLIMNDPGVSRLHAMIFHDSVNVGVLDLVSRNGTYVNGQEIEATLLNSGDEIRIGNSAFRFTLK